ncbi:hypothetical protein [Flavobacterium geliluteum]|uniref:Uncharacterized protein n=1 Tax=Flavobacterium geliluteum TaxID=2816120 RepID=A0A940XA63_9FLAO|nr:hypothetical protein [Flavobacterium geliluteum]MBP4139411.1 hypothetical protein [Flavobacterium geliluteum]
MTNKIIKYTIILATIILWSCEKESVQDSSTQGTKPIATKYLNAEELPSEFQNYFIQNNANNSAKSNSNGTNLSSAIFTKHDIISMTDDKNITNYSISFYYPNTPENIFYNLVINVLPTGEHSTYIFKYICNPENFENFKAHNFDFNYFVGVTEISLASSPSNSTLTSKINSGDDDCPKIYIPTNNSGTNSGTGVPAGSGGSGSSGSPGYNTSVPGYNAPGHTGGSSPGPSTGGSGGHNHSNCYGSNGQFWYFAGDVRPPHSHTEKNANDCPDLVPPSGNVPVNTMPMIKVLGKELALSSTQIAFLRDRADVMNAVNQFMEENSFSYNSKEFMSKLLVEIINNPNLRFDINASFRSPMNIERSTITNATPEGKKFNEIYDTLTNSPKFKELFMDMFGADILLGNYRHNVKFELADAVYDEKDPTKEINGSTIYDPNLLYLVIKINKKILNNSIMGQTKIENARTIIHEFIHAYLFTVTNNPIIGPTDIVSLFNKKYPNANEQHNFMTNNMVPTMQTILSQIRDLITTPSNRVKLEAYTMHPTANPLTSEPFNWDNYYKYISLAGLQGTNSFTQNFPDGSDRYSLYKQYINAGNNELDR